MEPGSRPRGSPAQLAGRTLANLAGFVRDAAVAPFAYRISREWLALRLDLGVAEAPRRSWLWRTSVLPAPGPLANVLEALRLAAGDARVRGVFVRVGRGPIGWAQVASLARALTRVRESGRKLVVYAEATGNAGAWLGGLADHFWMAPAGRLDLLGIRVESIFLRGALDRLRIRPEVLSAGRYKSLGEMLDRDSMSPEAREALEAIVDDFYAALVDGLAAGKAGDVDRAGRWIDGGPYLAAEALEQGIVDDLVYGDEIPTRLAELGGAPVPRAGQEFPKAQPIGEAAYLRLARRRFVWTPISQGPAQIAVVPVLGLIRPGAGSPRGVVGTLRRLERSDSVRAVVLRVDSPGGDPLASDLIWRATRKLAERKPVVASLGNRAASGGYYIAMGANEIVAEEATLTGSIGVVLAGLAFEELLAGVGVSSESIQRGKHAGIYSTMAPRSEEERGVLQRHVDGLYERFAGNAADSRNLSRSDLEEVAEGRVWSGRRASQNKLVDLLGGLELALERAETLAGLERGEGVPLYCAPQGAGFARLLPSQPLDRVAGAQLWCPIRVELA